MIAGTLVVIALGSSIGASAVLVAWCIATGAALGVLVQPRPQVLVDTKALLALRAFALAVALYTGGRAYATIGSVSGAGRPYVFALAVASLIGAAVFTFRGREIWGSGAPR
jgi:hypothetical protein